MGKLANLTIEALNGEYDVTYHATAPQIPDLIWADHTKATVTILNGKLVGLDEGGSKWEADIQLLPEAAGVQFSAVVDVSESPDNTFILTNEGMPTREKQRYQGTLALTMIANDLSLYGTIQHGVTSVTINLKRKLNDS